MNRKELAIHVARYIGFDVVDTLGSGADGTAYLLSDGNVLKLTSDFNEYVTATLLIGRKSRHLNEVFQTYNIAKSDCYTKYAIYSKYCETNHIMVENVKKVNDGLMQDIQSFVRRGDLTNLREKFEQNQNVGIPITEEEWQLLGIGEEVLETLIFRTVDLHPGNIGVNCEGNLCLIDFGRSGSTDIEDIVDIFEKTPKEEITVTKLSKIWVFTMRSLTLTWWLLTKPRKAIKSILST